ncbi:MAG TPA: hypothetical protein VER98_01380 [Terriglobia bacterium]|nr:hypothetical protein [Terriglobia bacterium]
MIVHINHVQPDRAALAGSVLSELVSLAGEGQIQPRILENLNVHLDWVQYKTNFRESVTLRRAIKGEELLPWIEVGVDLRQLQPETLKAEFLAALKDGLDGSSCSANRVYLEPFRPMRSCLIWRFNDLFWQHLPLWEAASGKGFEKALPGGTSDANHPEAVADAVADFWTLLKDLDSHNQLPPEIFVLEIGIGTGKRAALWLDRFRVLDRERGTQYYPRIRFLLSDYSMPTLNRAMATVREHRDLGSFLAVDALDPFKSLSFLRYKVLSIHLTNVYDNLPTDEIVVRDGKLYFVEVRSYVPAAAAARISQSFGIPVSEFVRAANRLLEVGPEHVHPSGAERGIAFWREVWDAMRLEERFVAIQSILDAPLPAGVKPGLLENFVGEHVMNQRFQLSSGAVESFLNTVPLLHPRGYLQVQDIFVTKLEDYSRMFRGPGKMDGSIVNWVNGALLAQVGAQAGYDVHFAPFQYREGSRTSILYTTQRE